MRRYLHALDVNDAHDIVDESNLKFRIFLSVRGHGGAAVDLEEPGLAEGVEDEIEAVELERVGTVGD